MRMGTCVVFFSVSLVERPSNTQSFLTCGRLKTEVSGCRARCGIPEENLSVACIMQTDLAMLW